MLDIYRIFEYNNGTLTELAFVSTKESTKFYLESCYFHNTSPEIFYFAQKINVEL